MKNKVKIVTTFSVLLLIGSSLIYFGSRNDAVSVAKSLKSGVLMADEVNVAFQNVGGRVISRAVQESQQVKQGDVLMVLDDVDTRIAINRTQAVIRSQEAQIRQEESAIRIEESETDLLELSNWRKIEELQARLDAAHATETLAKLEFERTLKLSKTGSVSQSLLDNAQNTLTRAHMDVVQTQSQIASATIGATAEQMTELINKKRAEGMTLQSIANTREKIKNRENLLDQLRAQLEQSKAELEQLEVNHSRLTLVAPEDGKILKLLYEDGEMVPSGAPAVILETNRKYVDIYVNENMVINYQPGTAVNARIPALDSEVSGVIRFATAASSFSDLRMTRERGQADLISYQVRIYTAEHVQLLTGMTLEVDDAEHH